MEALVMAGGKGTRMGFCGVEKPMIEVGGIFTVERVVNALRDSKHIDRILNMYHRTANYPCVTILSLGNEAGNGTNFYNAYRELKALEKDGQNRQYSEKPSPQLFNNHSQFP